MNVADKLQAAGLKVKVTGNKIVTWAANSSHPKEERIEIVVDDAGKVVSASKYAYLLPESVGDDVRLD